MIFESKYGINEKVVFAPFGINEPDTAVGMVVAVKFGMHNIKYDVFDDETLETYKSLTESSILSLSNEA